MTQIGIFAAMGLISLLLFSCGGVSDLADNSTTPINSTQPCVNCEPLNPSPVIQNEIPEPTTDGQWDRINNPNAERNCFEQAKSAARASGYSESVVYSCRCTPNENEETKTYNCVIATADIFDPNKDATIRCVKQARTCTVNADGQVYIYTFDQMENFVN